MNVAIDTNIFVYASAFDDEGRRSAAIDLLGRLPKDQVVVPVQVFGEFYNVLTRKLHLSTADATNVVMDWTKAFSLAPTSARSFFNAIEIASVHQMHIWDAVILAVAAESGCSLLLTEDMHEGFTWRGVTVTNPFKPNRHDWLDVLLDGQ